MAYNNLVFTCEIWRNRNGWHWILEAASFEVSSVISYDTAGRARAAARRILTKNLGLNVDMTISDE